MEVSMSTLFYLSSAQMDVIRPLFPRSRGIPRRDDQKIISELSMFSSSVSDGRMLQKNTAPIKLFITVLSDGVTWASSKRFLRLFPKVPRTHPFSWLMLPVWKLTKLPQVWEKRASSRCIGRTKGGLNTKLHVVCDFDGRSIRTLLTAGTISDYGGAAYLLPTLPSTRMLLADRCYDAGWIRSFLKNRGCTPCIPSRKNAKSQEYYDKKQYRQRHKIENMFSRLKDWRRIATRYDCCAHTFLSAIHLAAIVIFYL